MGTFMEKYIRARIEELRLKSNLSEYQLSLDSGRSAGYIQSISSGRTLPSMQAFLEICDYFDITPLEFFTPNIQNPSLLHMVSHNLEKCTDEELQLIDELIKHFQH